MNEIGWHGQKVHKLELIEHIATPRAMAISPMAVQTSIL